MAGAGATSMAGAGAAFVAGAGAASIAGHLVHFAFVKFIFFTYKILICFIAAFYA